jgi:hypothetical protein
MCAGGGQSAGLDAGQHHHGLVDTAIVDMALHAVRSAEAPMKSVCFLCARRRSRYFCSPFLQGADFDARQRDGFLPAAQLSGRAEPKPWNRNDRTRGDGVDHGGYHGGPGRDAKHASIKYPPVADQDRCPTRDCACCYLLTDGQCRKAKENGRHTCMGCLQCRWEHHYTADTPESRAVMAAWRAQQ